MGPPKVDEIGRWTEVKLDILKRYAVEYSKILSTQKDPSLAHVYIDAFAGTGFHLSKTTGEMVLGSPLNVLLVQPAFQEYHLIDLDGDKVDGLRELVGKKRTFSFTKVTATRFSCKKCFQECSTGTIGEDSVCLIRMP